MCPPPPYIVRLFINLSFFLCRTISFWFLTLYVQKVQGLSYSKLHEKCDFNFPFCMLAFVQMSFSQKGSNWVKIVVEFSDINSQEGRDFGKSLAGGGWSIGKNRFEYLAKNRCEEEKGSCLEASFCTCWCGRMCPSSRRNSRWGSVPPWIQDVSPSVFRPEIETFREQTSFLGLFRYLDRKLNLWKS